ncbi:hypothetical protein SCARR_04362 [Pontiella sulfatireligans]|uniref:Lipocalin-like domain-containing protein n=2 Tax=Pontiella sulfatireligans TaxID=2750658 RepID=A0A6C2UPQ1_9BACT|nr:hypothetical protein SCARR_04362 [Pontiella sulfatireligans]
MVRFLILFLAAATFYGCGNDETGADASETAEAYPADLQRMQGQWQAVSTNVFCMCEAIIVGPTIRLRYQLTPDSSVLKRNVSIRNVDEARKMLVMYDGLGAWTYDLRPADGAEGLELRFFDEINREWAQVLLIKVAVDGVQ